MYWRMPPRVRGLSQRIDQIKKNSRLANWKGGRNCSEELTKRSRLNERRSESFDSDDFVYELKVDGSGRPRGPYKKGNANGQDG